MASLCHTTKEKILSKNSTKTATWKLVPGLSVFVKNYAQPILESEFSEATYIRYVTAKLSEFVQISMQTSSDSF